MTLPTGTAMSLLRCVSLPVLLLVSAPIAAVADGAPRVDNEIERSGDSRAAAVFVGGNFSVMAGGFRHTCALTTDGTAYCWGNAFEGMLGNGQWDGFVTTPTRVTTDQRFVQLAAGSDFTCGVNAVHEVWCWGTNWAGQLGNGSTSHENRPVRVSLPEGAVDLSLGQHHACAVVLSGPTYCWGNNSEGQVGDGTTSDRPTPVTVYGGHSFSDIHAFGGVTCGITAANRDMYCWGENWIGQLGNGTTDDRSTPTLVSGGIAWQTLPSGSSMGFASMCALDALADLWCWGEGSRGETGGNGDTSVPTRVSGAPRFVSLTQGMGFYCGIDGTKQLYCWGWNASGQRGIGSFTSGPTPTQVPGSWDGVSAGHSHTCAISGTDGYCWGGDFDGRVGIGSTLGSAPVGVTNSSITDPVAGGTDIGCGLDTATGNVYCWGEGWVTEFTQRSTPTLVGGGHSFAGSLTVGYAHACAIDQAGVGWCWGTNEQGALGDGATEIRFEPTQVSGGLQWQKISAGRFNTCGVATTGEAYCWGEGGHGQLGTGDQNPSLVPALVVRPAGVQGWLDIETGHQSTCAIADVDPGSGLPVRSAHCWGNNEWGGLGVGHFDLDAVTTPQLVVGGKAWQTLAVGYEFTVCGSTTDQEPYCWGRGDKGQLGSGTTQSQHSPQLVSGGLILGPSDTEVAAIDVGIVHVCARDQLDEVLCWGDNTLGQLGSGVGASSSVPVRIPGIGGASNLAVGSYHSCSMAGAPKCWGRIGNGALGNGQMLAFNTPQMLAPLPTTPVYTLGDSVQGNLATSDQVDLHLFALNAGDTVDIAAFTANDTGLHPRVELYDPDGGYVIGYQNTRVDPYYAAIIASQPIDRAGTWEVRVSERGDGTTGGYTLRTRGSGPIAWSRPSRSFFLSVAEGAPARSDTMFIKNLGLGTATWDLTTDGATWFSTDRTTGSVGPRAYTGPSAVAAASTMVVPPILEDLSGSMAGVAMAVDRPQLVNLGEEPVVFTMDPAGLGQGSQFSRLEVTLQEDGWANPHVTYPEIRVYDPGFQVIAEYPGSYLWGLHASPDQSTALAGFTWSAVEFDLTTGAILREWDTGEHGAFISGFGVKSDGTILATVNNSGRIITLNPDGSTSILLQDLPNTARGLVVLPDDRVFYNGSSQLKEMTGSGQVDVGDAPGRNGAIWDMTYDPSDGLIYMVDWGGTVHTYDPYGGAWGTAGAFSIQEDVFAITRGASGRTYVCGLGAAVRWLEADGTTEGATGFQPNYEMDGLALIDNKLLVGAAGIGPSGTALFGWDIADSPAAFQSSVIALGDSATGTFNAAGESRDFALDLTQGQVIDLGVFSTDLGTGLYPNLVITGPSGDSTSAQYDRFACDEAGNCTPYAGRALAGYVVPATGMYTVQVRMSSDSPGPWVLRTREASGMVVTDSDRIVLLSAPAGGTASVDTVYVFNTGPTAIAWEIGGSSVLDLSPTSGTAQPASAPMAVRVAAPRAERMELSPVASLPAVLRAMGLRTPTLGVTTDPAEAPANATPVVVTFDPAGLPANTALFPDEAAFVISTPSDASFRDAWMGVGIAIHQPEFEVIAKDLPTQVGGIAVQDDGRVAVAANGGILTVDPSSGAVALRVGGLASWDSLWNMVANPVSGDLYYVSDFRTLHRMRPDNGVNDVFSHEYLSLFGVDVAPDGTLWIGAGDRIIRVTPDGTAMDIMTGPTNQDGFVWSVEYDHVNDLVYFGDGTTVKKYDPADQSVSTVIDLIDDGTGAGLLFDMEIGRSGHLYVRAFVSMYEIDPADGSNLNEWIVPMGGTGLTLAEGALYGTGMQRQEEGWLRDWLWKLPVDDGPQPITTKPIVAWADGVTASQGDTVTAAVSIDMSQNGSGIGSFEARMTWDTAVVSFVSVSSDFSGTFTPNTDSTNVGVIRFAGINTNAGANTDTTRLAVLRLVAKGKWGSETMLDLDIPELALPDFTNVTDQMDVFNGYVLVSPGTYTVAMRGETSVSKDESRPIKVRAYLKDLKPGIGAIQARVPFDNSVLRVDSVTAGDYGGTFDSNTAMQADSGFVRFAVVQVSPPTVDSTDLATVWVTAKEGTQGGDSTTVSVVFEEIADPVQFADLLPFLVGNEPIKVGVTTGIWGDTNKDKKITALDALICLSAVVGKDVSQFDATACDVAPDDGTSFIGKVTALDALAILSFVVGKTLPETFRVGESR